MIGSGFHAARRRARLMLMACAALCLARAALAAPPVIEAVAVLNGASQPVTRLVPLDRFLIDVGLSDQDGFSDIDRIEVTFQFGDTAVALTGPALQAVYAYVPAAATPFVRVSPDSSTWTIDPAASIGSNSGGAKNVHTIRFAIDAGAIARATEAGQWSIRVRATSLSNDGVAQATVGGLQMESRIRFTSVSPQVEFSPGTPGQTDLALVRPVSGAVAIGVVTNAPSRLRGAGADLVGVTDSTSRLIVGGPAYRVRWKIGSGPVTGLDNALADLVPAIDPNVTESPQTFEMQMFVDHPSSLPVQRYAGTLTLRIEEPLGTAGADTSAATLATVTATGLAALSARAEVMPHAVEAGATAQPFDAWMLPTYGSGTSGINRIRIPMPAGYGTPTVSGVSMGGAPVAFTDRSAGGRLEVTIPQTTVASRVRIQFAVDVTSRASPVASAMPLFFDDTLTTDVQDQAAGQGDANGVADGNHWNVVVNPGPLAIVTISPPSASIAVGGAVAFGATTTDAFGNPVSGTVTWRAEGAAGTIDAGTGAFTAIAGGVARVIASSAAVEDTAWVTVSSAPQGVAIEAVIQSPGTLIPGAVSRELLRFRLANHSAAAETLTALTVADRSSALGTTAQVDSSWSALELEIDGPFGQEAFASARFALGVARFQGLLVRLAPGDAKTIVIRGGASLRARDGDVLDLGLTDRAALELRPATTPTGSWPVDPAGGFAVDGMSAAQLTLVPAPAATFLVGTGPHLALQIHVPANGYVADELVRLNLVNRGTALPGSDLSDMRVWVDDGDGVFDPSGDTSLGALQFTGDRWEITALGRPVPLGGVTLFVTVDVADLAVAARTIRLALPTLPDAGIGMSSGNSGPVDFEMANPFDQVTSTADRILVTAAPIAHGLARPNARNLSLLAITASNTYSGPRHLLGLVVTNSTLGSGTIAQLDAEVAHLQLRLDGDSDGALDDPATDPVLANSAFLGGHAVFGGFDVALAPGQGATLFVTAELSPRGATDGDSLSAQIARALDVSMDTPCTIAAAWPVTSRARWAVDGMIAQQIANLGAPGATLAPGDSLIRALDVILPANGYAPDVLHSVRLMNHGSAGPTELSELRLWRDDGDGVFEVNADSDLGPLTLFNGAWQSPYLNEAIGGAGARLFATVTASMSSADSTTLQLGIPVGGIVTESGNRGPLDAEVLNPDVQTFSTSPLLATISATPQATTPGEAITVRMSVRNVGSERIDGVTPGALVAAGTGAASFTGGPAPAQASLDPGASASFTWSFVATSAGDLRWSGGASGSGAPSGFVRRSLIVPSNRHQIFTEAESLGCFAVQSMPFAVDPGQTGVVPLSLTFSNDGVVGSSDVRLTGLRVRLESAAGGPVLPADVLARIVVHEGPNVYLTKTALETTGSSIDLTLATPVVIARDEPVTVGLRLDIASDTQTSSFRLVIDDSTMFRAEDATSGQPVSVLLRDQAYPIRSGLARIVAGVTELDLSSPDTTLRHAGRGQARVPLMTLRLENPGVAGLSSDARLGSLALGVVDSAGRAIGNPTSRITRLELDGPFATLVDRALTAADDSVIVVTFSPFVTVPLNEPLDLTITGDIALGAPAGILRVVVRDSARIDARDANTGDPVAAKFATNPLPGPPVRIELAADQMRLGGTAGLPDTVPAGRTGLRAFTASLRHPGDAGVARIRIDSLTFELRDESRRPIAAGAFIDALHVLWNGTEVASIANPSAASAMSVAVPGLRLDPGAADTVVVVLDLQATAPSGWMELVLEGDGVVARDDNSGNRVAVIAESGSTLPVSSGVTRLTPPALALTVDFEGELGAALPEDSQEIPVGRVVLTNAAAAGSGPVQVRWLRLIAADKDKAPLRIGILASTLRAYRDGALWAASAPLTPDSAAAFLGGSELTLAPQQPVTLEIRMVPRSGGAEGTFRIGLDGNGVGIVQPSSMLLSVAVRASNGKTFPLWTDVASFTPTSLAASYSNFPNPFAAGRQPTRFVFNLPARGNVSLTMWTPRGERVVTLLDRVAFAAGLHQSTTWDGRNGRGLTVANGVYVAELVTQLDDGSHQRLLRKVMVVR